MSLAARYAKAAFWGGAIVFLGYGVMRASTPTDEQFYKSLSPDLRRKVDEHRNAQARADQYAKIKALGEAGEPVFLDSQTGVATGVNERRR